MFLFYNALQIVSKLFEKKTSLCKLGHPLVVGVKLFRTEYHMIDVHNKKYSLHACIYWCH